MQQKRARDCGQRGEVGSSTQVAMENIGHHMEG